MKNSSRIAIAAAAALAQEMFEKPRVRRFDPLTCPTCEYDRRFPGFEGGGWMQQDNNGPIVSCPVCNPEGAIPRDRSGQ